MVAELESNQAGFPGLDRLLEFNGFLDPELAAQFQVEQRAFGAGAYELFEF